MVGLLDDFAAHNPQARQYLEEFYMQQRLVEQQQARTPRFYDEDNEPVEAKPAKKEPEKPKINKKLLLLEG